MFASFLYSKTTSSFNRTSTAVSSAVLIWSNVSFGSLRVISSRMAMGKRRREVSASNAVHAARRTGNERRYNRKWSVQRCELAMTRRLAGSTAVVSTATRARAGGRGGRWRSLTRWCPTAGVVVGGVNVLLTPLKFSPFA